MRLSVEADFGLKRAHLLKKLENDQPGLPKWRAEVAALLQRDEDAYTLDEVEMIAEVIYTRLDAGVVREPDGYSYGHVRVARKNRSVHRRVLRQIERLKGREPAAATPPASSRRGARPKVTYQTPDDTDRLVLHHVSGSRIRVLHNGNEVGYIWRTRRQAGKVGEYATGWVHSLLPEDAKNLFTGSIGKQEALEDLLKCAARRRGIG